MTIFYYYYWHFGCRHCSGDEAEGCTTADSRLYKVLYQSILYSNKHDSFTVDTLSQNAEPDGTCSGMARPIYGQQMSPKLHSRQ